MRELLAWITRVAAEHYKVQIALVTLSGADQTELEVHVGLDATAASDARLFSTHARRHADVLVVSDVALDARFKDHPLVTNAPFVRFYAGAPVVTAQGEVLGSLCLFHSKPRDFDADDAMFLRHLAAFAATQAGPRSAGAPCGVEQCVLDAVTDAVVGVDADLNVSYLNRAACRSYDLTAEQIGRPLADIFPEVRDELACWQALQARRPWCGEMSHRLASGRVLLVALTLTPVVDATGTPRGQFVFLRDVTRQRAEEKRLKILESVAVYASDAVLITNALPIDAPGGPEIIYVNDAFCRMTGYDAREVLGRTPRFLQGPRTDRRQLDKVRHALETWSAVTVELVNYRKDGGEFVAEVSLVPVSDPQGRYTHWIGIQRDVTERRRQEERLRLLESVVVHASDAIIISAAEPIDEPGPRVVYVNEAYTRMTGYQPHEIIGRNPRIMQGVGTDRDTLDRIRRRLSAWQPVNETVLNYTKDGRPFWVSLAITPVADETGWYTHWVSVQRDVTHDIQQLALERDRREVLELVTAGAPLPEVLAATLRLLEHQLDGMTASILLLQDDRLYEGVRSNLPVEYREAVNGFTIGPDMGSCGAAAFEQRTIVTRDISSDPRWAAHRHLALTNGLRACWSSPIVSERRTVLGTFGVYAYEPREPTATERALLEDKARLVAVILERYQALHDMQRLALYDPLTGLANRTFFNERLRAALVPHSEEAFVAVGLLDVDRFKLVNDTLGHTAGDELLCMIASRLARNLPVSASVARMGGDEFTLLFERVRNHDELREFAQRVLDVFRAPFLVAGQELFVSASLGFSLHPQDASEPNDLLRLADIAMYHAKRKNLGWTLYEPHITTSDTRRVVLEAALHRALERNELSLHYQPLLHAHTQRVCAVEGLLRWTSAEFGRVSPDEFISIAEDNGLIVPIGQWALQSACRAVARWRRDWPDLKVGVNLSFKQFSQVDLVSCVRQALHDAALPPDALTLEITESVLMDFDEALPKVQALRALGVGLAIDDFGTGYSSLSYLKRLPVQAVKLDRSFIAQLDADVDGVDAHVVRATVLLARGMKIELVAEGVETVAQAAFLREVGVTHVQGWLFGRAVPEAEVAAVLTGLAGPASAF